MGICSSGEVEGVVDFREEEEVAVRSLEDEATEANNRSDRFPDDDGEETGGDLSFRDVVVKVEVAMGFRGEVALVSVALVETTPLVGLLASCPLGRRGGFEAIFVNFLASLTSSELSFFRALDVVVLLNGFRAGGENTFGLGGTVLFEGGAIDKVDADLRIAGGDMTPGLRATPETVRLRTGVGVGEALDFADNAEMGDFVGSGCED